MIKVLFFLFSFVLLNTGEANIQEKYGTVIQTKFKPENSPVNFQYDIVYYLPKKLEGKKELKTLVFLHGGGASTSTRNSSLQVIKDYLPDLKQIADELGVVLVMPSGSGLNWGGHTISFLKDLNQEIRKKLPVDANQIVLSGHSMGGMGITRIYQWLTDEYSFFMPVAAGLEEKNALDNNLSSIFNTSYYHLQGKHDHFEMFVTRSLEQKKKMEALEVLYGIKSGFSLELYDGNHNYNLPIYKNRLKTQFENTTRNLYQKTLFGNILYMNEALADQWSNGIKYYKGPRDRYFWIKGMSFNKKNQGINLKASIENNLVDIKIEEGIKILRVYLDTKMIDLNSPVEIVINNKTMTNQILPLQVDAEALKKDPAFKFDTFIDITL